MAQVTDFFVGANSGEGFQNLFSELVDIEDTYDLMVLKGGPGVGKNTFMKEVARAMEAAGTPVERLWCSGDPDSLDGVVLPELRCAVADGTSPHGSVTKGHSPRLSLGMGGVRAVLNMDQRQGRRQALARLMAVSQALSSPPELLPA